MNKKIAVISISMSPILDTNLYLYNFIEILTHIHEKIIIISNNFPKDKKYKNKIQKIDINTTLHQMDKIKPIWWTNIIQFFKVLIIELKICRSLTKIKNDVDVVFFFMGGYHLFPCILFGKILKKKVVVTAFGRGSLSYEKSLSKGFFSIERSLLAIMKLLENANFSLSDLIITESESTVDFLKLQNYKQKIVTTGARFINTELFKIKKVLNERENLIGYIGRLEKVKGIMNFVTAIPLIYEQDNHIKFFIGGDGSLTKEIKTELIRNNLASKVEIIGWIPHHKIPDYLNNLKLFVLPSYSEGLPTGILEAMACGTPTLAMSVGGIPDVIKDCETGFIMNDNSPKCIAENVLRSLKYQNLDTLIQNAYKLVEDKFAFKTVLEKYKMILKHFDER